MKTILIAALSENGVIGRDNTIPWHYPADMKHFRRVTRGHAVVAGRKTYETFQTRPCPSAATSSSPAIRPTRSPRA